MACEVLKDCEVFVRINYGGDRITAGKNKKGQVKYCQSNDLVGCVKHTILSPDYLCVLAMLLERVGLQALQVPPQAHGL